jgi:hypothetical protein
MTRRGWKHLARSRKGEAGLQEAFVALIFFASIGVVATQWQADREAEFSPERLQQIRDHDTRTKVEQARPEFQKWALAALDYEGYIACVENYPWPAEVQICGPEPTRPWEVSDIDPTSPEFLALGREQDPAKQRVIQVFMTWQGREDRDSVVPDPSLVVQHRYRWTRPSVVEALLLFPGAVVDTAADGLLGTVGADGVITGDDQTSYEWGEWGRRIE